MDNFEHLFNELIENKINTFWNNTPSFVLNNVHYSPNEFIREYFRKLMTQLNKNESQYQNDFKILSDKINEIQIKFDNLTIENQKLKNEIGQLKEKIIQLGIKPNASPIASIKDNMRSSVSFPIDSIIEIFNEWAREPKTRLPSQFIYADGELKLREKQNINKSDNNNSLWIINKSGIINYLFPNPNAIDEIWGNIDTVYTVTGTRKAKGQNRINVLKACEIKDDGWIEYKGELSLL